MKEPELMNLNYKVITDHKSQIPWKKLISMIIFIFILLITIITLIIVYMIKNNTPHSDYEDNNNQSNKDNKKDDEKIIYLGEITCKYSINSIEEEIQILSEEYNKTNDFDIYYNNTIIVEFSKKIQFNETGIIPIKYALKEDINMEKMFKNISSLISITLTSDNSIKLISIESAFENCINLESFTMSGIITTELTSLKKLFYNTKISSLSGFTINSKKITDMSYLFSNTKLTSLDLSNLQTNKVINMSNMFSNSVSLEKLSIKNFDISNAVDILI